MSANRDDRGDDPISQSPFVREAFSADEEAVDPVRSFNLTTPFTMAFAEESAPIAESEGGGAAHREPVKRVTPTTAAPWRWICQIGLADFSSNRPLGGGTGCLISDRHVLTAAHVVWQPAQDMHLLTVTVIPGYDDGQEPFGRAVASKIRICPRYRPEDNESATAAEWDYALITLNSAIGGRVVGQERLGFWGAPDVGDAFKFGPLETKTFRDGHTAGYPSAKGGTTLWQASGYLAVTGPNQMRALADMTRGQSGSPVWVEQDGHTTLLGVAANFQLANNAVRRITKGMIDELRGWIAEDGDKAALPQAMQEAAPVPERSGVPTSFSPQATTVRSAREIEESEYVGEGPDPEFDTTATALGVSDALARQDWQEALKLAIDEGCRDPNELTDLIFFARHPELTSAKLDPKAPNYRKHSQEWSNLLEQDVWTAIQAASDNAALAVDGKEVADHDRFFWGPNGKRFKQLVQEMARAVDLNPGLLGAIMMSETRDPLTYLSDAKVSSYYIGTDDFYEAQAAMAQRVPAYAKVGWDKTQTPVVHPNDATTPRDVKTILFNSGRDAALAIAVYIKFREVRLREIAVELGGDFDKLPVETRFALTRMAMAAGTGGATGFLKDALAGNDILVRKNIPVKIYQTQRNATVRAAQAMHLSEWIFGIKLQNGAQKESEFPRVDEGENGDGSGSGSGGPKYDRAKAVDYARNFAFKPCSDGFIMLDATRTAVTLRGMPTVRVPSDAKIVATSANSDRLENADGSIFKLSDGTDLTFELMDDCTHFISCCIGTPPGATAGGLKIRRQWGSGTENPYGISRVGGDPGDPPGLIDVIKNNKLAVEVATRTDDPSKIALLEPGDLIAYFLVGKNIFTHLAIYLGDEKIATHTISRVDFTPWQIETTGRFKWTLLHFVV
jgi:V8-like Glu-specific endopeptidase